MGIDGYVEMLTDGFQSIVREAQAILGYVLGEIGLRVPFGPKEIRAKVSLVFAVVSGCRVVKEKLAEKVLVK